MLGIPAGASKIVVACSGGSDSAAALFAVRSARPNCELIACYVDHGVRPRANVAADKRAVKAQAKAAGAEFASVRLTGEADEGNSPEARLRARRYKALAAFARSQGASIVITGHQRDDVAESSLMALVRGSGIDGIAAMRPRRSIGDGVDVARPLLWAPKALLAEYVRSKDAPVALDETNADEGLRRNAIRRVLADLESIAPGSRHAIARGAAIANDDKALLDAVAASAWRRVRSPDGTSLVASELRRLPDALLRRVLRIEVRRVAGDARDFTYAHCAAIASAIRTRRGGTFHAGRAKAELSAGRASFVPASSDAPRHDEAVIVAAPRASVKIEWGGGTISLRRVAAEAGRRRREQAADAGTVLLDSELLPPGAQLVVRSPRTGDRFVPAGRRSTVGVARFLGKAGLPLARRRRVPLLCKNGSIAAAIGVRASAAFAARPGRRAIEVRWLPPQT